MTYAILLPDGHLITDPDWHTVADVMRGAHGQNVTRMPGELVQIPRRIQRQRTKGWRMPAGAVYVGRGTQWGNPWRVGWPVMTQTPTGDGDGTLRGQEFILTADLAVALYRAAFTPDADDIRAELAGLDLACWCPLDSPCHADVLLEIANGGD